jgi:hypothetical protein
MLEVNGLKVMAYMRSTARLQDVHPLYHYEGTHPKTFENIRVSVLDYGQGFTERFEVTAWVVGNPDSLDRGKGENLEEAMRDIRWEKL